MQAYQAGKTHGHNARNALGGRYPRGGMQDEMAAIPAFPAGTMPV